MSKILVLKETIEQLCWQNAEGTSINLDNTCGSWKQHYINVTKMPWPEKCSRLECFAPAHDGCHVINNASFKGKMYIVPLCSKCNHINGTFSLKHDTKLVEIIDSENKLNTTNK